MTSLTTLEFSSAIVADAERHWLYGHPYRAEPTTPVLMGGRARRAFRVPGAGGIRSAAALLRRRGLAL